MLACVRKITPANSRYGHLKEWRRKAINKQYNCDQCFKACTKLGNRIFDKWKQTSNKAQIKLRNYKGYEDGCSIHANRPRTYLKTSYKRKNLPWRLKAGKIKKKYLKTDQWYIKAKWRIRRRLKIHSHKPTSSTQSSHLQKLSSH